jgi:hypothetical protein
MRCETPMASDALTLLRTPVSVDNPLMGPTFAEAARSLLGMGEWLVIQYRFDGHPAFVIIAGRVGFLTRIVLEARP